MFSKEIFKIEKSWKKNNISPNPNLYWMVIFSFGLLLTVAVFVFGFLLFAKVSEDIILSQDTQNVELEKIKKERINKVLNIFETRADNSKKIINSPAPFVDPSL